GAPAERAALLGLCYGVRLVALLAALGALGAASGLWAAVPGAWPAMFLAALALGTATARMLLLRGAEALERSGALRESVAALGAPARARSPWPGGLPRHRVALRPDALRLRGDGERRPRDPPAPLAGAAPALRRGRLRVARQPLPRAPVARGARAGLAGLRRQ